MMFSLKGKTALVTGGGTGIGLAIVKTFLEAGAFVYISGRRSEPLNKTVEELSVLYPGFISGYPCDNQKKENIESLAAYITQAGRGLDILVNNAGVQYIEKLEHMPEKHILNMFNTNVYGMLNMSLAMLPLLKIKGGKIVNMSSFVAEISRSGVVAYSATKGAIRQFTKGMAIEWAPYNIQVNAIACGVIDTAMNNCFSMEEKSALTDEIPAGRFGTPEEVASLILQLITSPSYLTGQIIGLDGGWM